MISRSMLIQVPKDVELRLAAVLVQVASQHDSSIYIQSQDRKVNAKSIMGMMSLVLEPGEEVTVIADGDDEKGALDDIEKFLSNQ